MTHTHQPLETLRYTLTRADALAWESRPREMRGWRRVVFLLWLGSAGVWLGLLPPDLTGDHTDWRFWAVGAVLVGVNWLIATGVMTLATHLRARRRVPEPVEVELEIWGDHLSAKVGERLVVFAHEMTAAAELSDRHLFIISPPEVLIIPIAAFEDPAEAAALAASIEAAGRDPD